MHHLWDHGIRNVTPETVRNVTSEFSGKRTDFRDWADNVGDSGLKAYRVLSGAGKTLAEARIRATLKPPPPDLLPAINALCYHGLVTREKGGNGYRITGDMFREWFENQPHSWNQSNFRFILNRSLLVLCIASFLLLMLQIFWSNADSVLSFLALLFGVVISLFPYLLKIPEKSWFQSSWMTIAMSIFVLIVGGLDISLLLLNPSFRSYLSNLLKWIIYFLSLFGDPST